MNLGYRSLFAPQVSHLQGEDDNGTYTPEAVRRIKLIHIASKSDAMGATQGLKQNVSPCLLGFITYGDVTHVIHITTV